MERSGPFVLCTHEEDLSKVKVGDCCVVRWDDNGTKRWHTCTVDTIGPTGCVVNWKDNRYDVSRTQDEVIVHPTQKIYDFINLNPESTVIEIGKLKYVIPSAQGSFGEAIDSINTLRRHRNQCEVEQAPGLAAFTVDKVASFSQFRKVVFMDS